MNSTKIKGNGNSHSTQILPEDRSENTLKLTLWDYQYNYSNSGKEHTNEIIDQYSLWI